MPTVDGVFDELVSIVSGEARTEALMRTGNRVGVLLESYARDIPERREGVELPKVYVLDGKPSKFKSHKQRIKVVMLGKQGRIPYRRGSPGLVNTITSQTTVTGDGVNVEVGTNYPNADKVIGPEGTQNRFLASLGWESLPKKIDEHMPDIRAEVVRSVADEVRRALRGAG